MISRTPRDHKEGWRAAGFPVQELLVLVVVLPISDLFEVARGAHRKVVCGTFAPWATKKLIVLVLVSCCVCESASFSGGGTRHQLNTYPRARFQVVCAIVLRDLEGLVDRYLRKMRKSFARMYWDEDYEDYEEEEDIGS